MKLRSAFVPLTLELDRDWASILSKCVCFPFTPNTHKEKLMFKKCSHISANQNSARLKAGFEFLFELHLKILQVSVLHGRIK